MKVELPRILEDNENESILSTVCDILIIFALILVILSFVTSVFMTHSLKAIWNLISVIQVIAFLKYFAPWPALCDQVLDKLFDAVYLHSLSQNFFNIGMSSYELLEQESKNAFLKGQGIQSEKVLKDIGIFTILAFVLGVLLLIYVVLKILAKKVKACKVAVDWFSSCLFYSGPILLITIGYLRFTGIFTSYFVHGFSSSDQSTALTILYSLLVLACIAWPICVIITMVNNQDKLFDKTSTKKITPLIDGIKTNSLSILLYNAVFSVRRFNLVLVNITFT